MKKDITLVILAGGMGSRFGGLKQIEPFGPNGEFIIDYSIFDAVQAGFNKVVFLIKEENFEIFKETIGKRIEPYVKVEYVFQGLDTIDTSIEIPKERVKPLGTAHAILCARDVVNEPFAIINADDFYGRDAFMKAYEYLSEVKKSLRINKENGNFVGSSVIYGYKKNPEDIHKLIVDDEAADIVREIFNMYLLGMTKSEIAKELNKREVMTPALYKKTHNLGYTKPKKDNKWDYEIIDRILRDENYTGTLVQGKRRNENYISHKEVKNPEKDWIKFENHHEELVSKEVFDKVQEMLKVQRRSTNKNDLLSGYLFCVDCNGPMALVKGKKNSYYYCRNSLNKKICTKHRIRQNDLYNKIIELLNLKKLDDKIIEELNRDLVTKYIDKIMVYRRI